MAATPVRTGSDERLGALLDGLDLPPTQREMLRQRWLDQMGWMSRQAKRARRRYYILRVPVIIGGLIIPALLSFTFAAVSSGTVAGLPFLTYENLRLITFFVSLGIAILGATEELLHYGDRWRHYRRTAERLKSLGWQYLELSGAFKRFSSHTSAFTTFGERVEEILGEEVEGYLGQVAIEGSSGHRDVVA